MINPEDPIRANLRISCTKDEAVAKLIGWLKGFIRRDNNEISERGISETELPHLHTLAMSLGDQLNVLRETARQELIKANDTDEDRHKLYEAVEKYDELINKSATYFLDIDDEIEKVELSVLKIDHEATQKFGVTHIKLRSLDKWARAKYGIKILEESNSNIETSLTPESQSILGDLSRRLNEIPLPTGWTNKPTIKIKTSSTQVLQLEDLQALESTKPWMAIDPRDPEPEQQWFTPARYFARQLIKDDSTLLIKRSLLTQKTVQSLTSVGIYKRGGVLPFDPETIKKALSNVSLG